MVILNLIVKNMKRIGLILFLVPFVLFACYGKASIAGEWLGPILGTDHIYQEALRHKSVTRRFIKKAGCNYPVFPSKPSREPFEGFTWGEVAGAGLRFWAQSNLSIRVITNDSIPGAQIEWANEKGEKTHRTVIQVFSLANGKIEDVFCALKKTSNWDSTVTCAFREISTTRKGVKRYVLELSGQSAEAFEERSRQEPVPVTCGGWGIGNSGARYFEIYANKPDKAVFVEIGQEAPLYDELSIVLTDSY